MLQNRKCGDENIENSLPGLKVLLVLLEEFICVLVSLHWYAQTSVHFSEHKFPISFTVVAE